VVEGALRDRPVTGKAPGRLPRPRGPFRVLRRDQRGTAVVEFALVALPLFLILFGIIDFGRALNYYNDMTQLAGQGARFAAVSQEPCNTGQAGCTPGSATGNFQQDLAAWNDSPELKGKVHVCIKNNPATTTIGSPVTVKVSYTFHFLSLISGIPITLTSTQTERSETSTPSYAQGGQGC
jgi:Flp pilus assembly protein TadG